MALGAGEGGEERAGCSGHGGEGDEEGRDKVGEATGRRETPGQQVTKGRRWRCFSTARTHCGAHQRKD